MSIVMPDWCFDVGQFERRFRDLLSTELLRSAWQIALEQHAGKNRRTGEAYILHPMAVFQLCLELGLSKEALALALLHDVVEDGSITLMEILRKFGANIAFKLAALTKHNGVDYYLQLEEASAIDYEVILVKMVDRFHNRICPYGKTIEEERISLEETRVKFLGMCRRCAVYIPDASKETFDSLYARIKHITEARLYSVQLSLAMVGCL
jgi:GTP diphosphokinase / guanosine-3',5'-bis(diphosphate) 3'-diphosphatase